MMRNASLLRRTRLVQLLNDWQNTGSQKGKFRDARLKLDSEEPIKATAEEEYCHLCPGECKETETNLHYLECLSQLAQKGRQGFIKRVLKRLKNLRTYDGITSMVGLILENISDRRWISNGNSSIRTGICQ